MFQKVARWFLNLFKVSEKMNEIVDPKNIPPWLAIAEKEIGVTEVDGDGNNNRIIEYHSATELKATEDSVPWCSAFVCWCLLRAGQKSTYDAWARSYLSYGEKLEKPIPGCVVVFSRGQESGHVGFFIKEDALWTWVLGGNQNDEVCIAKYAKWRVLAYRWPKGFPKNG